MQSFFKKSIILNKKWLIYVVLITLVGSACGAFISKEKEISKSNDKEKIVFNIVKEIATSYHFNKMSINDDYAKKVLFSLLKTVDKGKRFFIQEDINSLQSRELQLDDEFIQSSLETFEIYLKIIDKREKWVMEVVEKKLKNPVNLNQNKTIHLEGDSIQYAKNLKELEERWEDYLTFSVMEKMYQLQQRKDSVTQNLTLTQLEEKAREDVAEKFKEWFKRLKQMDRTDRFSLYVNSYLAVFDPHTQYFPPREKEDFDINFTGKLEGIGATLTEKDGYIKVSAIVSGSASWKQGELAAGDIILEVAQGKQTPVDVYNMRLDNAVRLIRGPKGTEVRLTVKKADGKVKIIPIIRDVVILEETYAKSLKIKENNDKNWYGYLSLESFYADFSDRNGRHCADDVLKELKNLKDSGAKGLILDLRNNGGGSLSDAVKMVGYFIDKGAVVQINGVEQSQPEVLSDIDPRIQFEFPLVVMVNNFSASASEIFAAAIQDYQRGVVVGVNTFGKGTVQRFFELDQLAKHFNAPQEVLPLGSIKQTISKFYRIDGGATQLKGVQPDIALPEPFMYVETGEKEYDFALPWSSIKSSNYKKIDRNYDINSLMKNSKNRIEKDTFFNTIDEQAKFVKRVQNKSAYPLNYKEFIKVKDGIENERKKFKENTNTISDWNLDFTSFDAQKMKTDTVYADRMKKFQESIQKDHYIKESLKILKEIP